MTSATARLIWLVATIFLKVLRSPASETLNSWLARYFPGGCGFPGRRRRRGYADLVLRSYRLRSSLRGNLCTSMLRTNEANDCGDCAVQQFWETARDPATALISDSFVKELADALEAAQTQAPGMVVDLQPITRAGKATTAAGYQAPRAGPGSTARTGPASAPSTRATDPAAPRAPFP